MSAADTIAEARALIEPLTGHEAGPLWDTRIPSCSGRIIANQDGKHIGSAFGVDNARVFAAAPALRDMVPDLADGWEAEKARADALAQENAKLLGLLREGADLLSEEADALKAGIGGEGEWETCADPVDQPTVQAIREIEEWIAKVAAMQPRAGSTP